MLNEKVFQRKPQNAGRKFQQSDPEISYPQNRNQTSRISVSIGTGSLPAKNIPKFRPTATLQKTKENKNLGRR